MLLLKRKKSYFGQWKSKGGFEFTRKRIKNISHQKKVSIGLIGCERGIGTTHLAVSLANYLVAKTNGKTAVVDCSKSLGLEASVYERFGVFYYTGVDEDRISYILNQDYEYFILDFGENLKRWKREIIRCDGRIFLGSSCSWKIEHFYQFIEFGIKELKIEDRAVFLAQFGEKKTRRELSKKSKVFIQEYPFIGNPFQLKKEAFVFLETIIEQIF